jgi:O-antigen biosynthesis protein
LADDRAFNFSALNNVAAKGARGKFLALLNNDVEVISPDWLSEMVSIHRSPEWALSARGSGIRTKRFSMAA